MLNLTSNSTLPTTNCIPALHSELVSSSHQNEVDTHSYIFLPLYLIVILISLLGNITVIVVVYARLTMHTFTNILICNCAATNLLITLFSAVFSVVDTLKTRGKWFIGPFMCSFVHFCVISAVAANIETLMTIAVDRLLAVTSPYKKILTKKMLSVIIPVIWVVAFAFASPVIYVQSVIEVKGYGPICVEQWLPPFTQSNSPKHYTIVLFICLYAVPLLLMTIIYVKIARRLGFTADIKIKLSRHDMIDTQSERLSQSWKLQIVDNSNAKTRMESSAVQGFKKGRVVQMMCTMVVVFACCWLPVFILQFISSFDRFYTECHGAIPDWAYALIYLMQYANSAIDPILYFWFSSSFKKELSAIRQAVLRTK